MKKICLILLAISAVILSACSKPSKKSLYNITIGEKIINIKMNRAELSKIYESHEADSGVVYFFLDSKDRDNNFNATFYSDGKIKTLYSMSETNPVIKFFKDIHLGMSKEELYHSLSIKSKDHKADLYLIKFSDTEIEEIRCFDQQNIKDTKEYVNFRKNKGVYMELFIEDETVGAVRIIHNL